MPSLIICKSYREIAFEGAAEHLSRLRGDTRRKIKPDHLAAGPCSVLIHSFYDLSSCSRERSCKACAEQGVDDHIRFEGVKRLRVPGMKLRAIGPQDPLLRHGGGALRRFFHREKEILNIIAAVRKKAPDRQSVRTVIAGSCQDRDSCALRCPRPDLSRNGERRPLHQHDGRDPYDFRRQTVRLRHFISRKQIFHYGSLFVRDKQGFDTKTPFPDPCIRKRRILT